jgi:hypothetical protein
MKLYDIWVEGYSATGQYSQASLLGQVLADSFQKACDKLCSSEEFQKYHGHYDRRDRTVWGCKLFANETAARRSFG